jgi:hypothetical protein
VGLVVLRLFFGAATARAQQIKVMQCDSLNEIGAINIPARYYRIRLQP